MGWASQSSATSSDATGSVGGGRRRPDTKVPQWPGQRTAEPASLEADDKPDQGPQESPGHTGGPRGRSGSAPEADTAAAAGEQGTAGRLRDGGRQRPTEPPRWQESRAPQTRGCGCRNEQVRSGGGPRACLFMKRRGERRTAPPAVASRAAATGRRPAGGKGTLRNPERSLAQAAGIPGSSPFLWTGLAHRDGTGRSAWGDHHISVTHSRLPLPCHPDLSYASWSPQLLLVPKHRLAEHPGLASPAPNPPGARLCSFPPLPIQGPRDAVSGRVRIQSQRCQRKLWAVPLPGK